MNRTWSAATAEITARGTAIQQDETTRYHQDLVFIRLSSGLSLDP